MVDEIEGRPLRPTHVIRILGLICVTCLCFAQAGLARAEPPQLVLPAIGAGEARLPLFTPDERALLAPFVERGPVMLVEFAEGEDLPAIVIYANVAASADEVARIVTDPEGYPRFLETVGRAEVTERRGDAIAYTWQWQLALFTMQATSELSIGRPPRGQPQKGYRINVRHLSGDIGRGRMLWRILPTGPTSSSIVLATRIDLRDANYVSRALARAARSINRSLNMAFAVSTLLGVKDEAERRAGTSPSSSAGLPPVTLPEMSIEALAPLLGRGDLLSLELDGAKLSQSIVLGRMGIDCERVRAVMRDPAEFGAALLPGSRATVLERTERGTRFEWVIDAPLIGTRGEMLLSERDGRIEAESISGALTPGAWIFDTPTLPWGECVVRSAGRFDPASVSWLVRAAVSDNPGLRFGLTAASQLMVTRAIRTRALGD